MLRPIYCHKLSNLFQLQVFPNSWSGHLNRLLQPNFTPFRDLCDHNIHGKLSKKNSGTHRQQLTHFQRSVDDLVKNTAHFRAGVLSIPIEKVPRNISPFISLKAAQNMVYKSLQEFHQQSSSRINESQLRFDNLSSLYQSFMEHFDADSSNALKANLFATTISTIEDEWITDYAEPLADIAEADKLLSDHIITICLALYSRLPQLSETDDRNVGALYDKLAWERMDTSPQLHLAIGRCVIMSSRYKDLVNNYHTGTYSAALTPLILRKLIHDDRNHAFLVLRQKLIELNVQSYGQYSIQQSTARDCLNVLLEELSSQQDLVRTFQTFHDHAGSLLEDIDIEIAEKLRTCWNDARSTETAQPKVGATVTTVNEKNFCANCGAKLSDEILTMEDTDLLKRTFYEGGIEEKGVQGLWKSSTPAERSKFLEFIDLNGPYDLIIDDLNLFYLSKSSPRRREQANKLLEAFRGRKVLVLTRYHRKKGVLSNRDYKGFDFFLTDNESSDDIWIIYAALDSGPDCHVFTGDHFSLHQMKLATPSLIDLFRRWQQLNQITTFGRSSHTLNLRVKTRFHPSNKGWHISIRNKYVDSHFQRYANSSPFLCLPTV